MSFRARLSVMFTLLVGVILWLFGTYLYVQSDRIREREFFERLDERAGHAEQVALEAQGLPLDEAERLLRSLPAVLPGEVLVVRDAQGTVVLGEASQHAEVSRSWLAQARATGSFDLAVGDRQVVVRASSDEHGHAPFYTIVSAVDEEGRMALTDLRRNILLGSLLLLLFTTLVSWLYATWVLVPVRLLVRMAGEIREPSERIVVPEGAATDELGSMATTFNDLLARIDAAFQVQRSFIANASHELRTPLTVLRGELHQAQQALAGNEEARAHLLNVEQQTVHMQDLLAQLLWLAQTQGPSERIATEEVRLDDVAERAMDRCRARYPDHSLRFSMGEEPEGLEPLVRGNAVLLTAALYNLLTNAVKYGGEQPVELHIGSERGEVHASVRDHGRGMAPDVLARVRDLFFRAGDAAPLDGHGIGLALVDRIARVHGGRLELAAAPGGGTVATLVFPAPRTLIRA